MGFQKNLRWVKRLVLLVFLAGGVSCGVWFYSQHYAEASPRYRTSAITRGEIVKVITASGQLNPVTMVDVGSQISGIIKELLADFNSAVTQRQVIARIDPSSYEASAFQAEANLASARASLELSQLEERRANSLRADKLNTQAEYETAQASLHQAEANVRMKEGILKSAQVDLARCTIYSPIDGLVLSRNVNVGQTVAASLSAPTLFVIANDLAKMQIEASISEADVGLVQNGQDVEFSVDAFPGQTFRGKVRQIRNAPKMEQTVVTYATIIDVANPDLKLKPGMTANVSVIVARREQALRVPNAAFRFRPPDALETKTTPPENQARGADARGRKKDQKKAERVVYLLTSDPGPTNAPVRGAASASLQAVPIRTGIDNTSYTEVVEGLKEGDEVVTGVSSAKDHSSRSLKLFANSSKR
jgi:HlyD family secretion protein